MYEKTYGPKYEQTKDLSKTELAKLIRKDIAEAIAAGRIPKGVKVSVRTRYYSGGGSIDLKVTALPAGFRIHRPELLVNPNDPVRFESGWRADEASALVKELDAIAWAYNFDGSDLQSDYFNVRFYSHVSFATELEQAERAAFEASQAVSS